MMAAHKGTDFERQKMEDGIRGLQYALPSNVWDLLEKTSAESFGGATLEWVDALTV